jgi:molybdenum cofactor sulfurtransferase
VREERFLSQYPEYAATSELDRLRTAEYARLDRLGHVYLDFTGAGLYAESQVREHLELLSGSVLANPHSHNPTSLAATELVERCRAKVLDYFHASGEEYVAVFTANASAALKLVGESFPFGEDSAYLLTYDNHNSVNGIREFARARGAGIRYVPMVLPEMRVDEAALRQALDEGPAGAKLFAYPAQSNFSGVQHWLGWVAEAQSRGWKVLLDAAAFVPANALDLREVKPDFVSLSFYKMFGYPTGVGCLLARREALAQLRRPWFAGGTITVASVQGDRYFLHEGASAFEDGTLDFLALPAVEIGLRHLERAGLDVIHQRVRCLTGWLIGELAQLAHGNGNPVVRLYGPSNLDSRGGTVTMNFYGHSGAVMDHREVEESAARHGISLRTGCFCNPGDGEIALHLTRNELEGCFSQAQGDAARYTIDDFRLCVTGKSTGAVRVSLGLASNFADVERFLQFAREMAG